MTIGDIRQQLGISQEYMAHLLNISRSLLKLVERGERSLPFHALKRVTPMRIAISPINLLDEPPRHFKRPVENLAKELDDLDYWCLVKARHYEQLVAFNTYKNQQAQNCLDILPGCFADIEASNEVHEKIALVLSIIYRESRMQLAGYPADVLAKCLVRSRQLRAIAESGKE